MDRLIYVAMSGAREAMRAQAVTAHNLANIATTGFRGFRQMLDSAPVQGAGMATRVNTVAMPEAFNSSQGANVSTGRDLDVAIQGKGWITVQSPEGGEAYTRAGDLRINTNGLLETGAGHLVMGDGGPVSVPPYEKIFIGNDGQISIVPQGQTAESMVQLDRIRLVNPAARELVRSGDGLFALRDGSSTDSDPTVQIASGQLESSNVNPAQALAEMIEMSRHYEMQVRAMNSADEMESAAARLIRMTG